MLTRHSDEEYRELIPGVELRTVAHGERTLMGLFRIAAGAVIPVHTHPHEQTGYLVSGRLRFTVDGARCEVGPGDAWNLAAGVPHGAEGLEDALVLEVFAPPREDYLAGVLP